MHRDLFQVGNVLAKLALDAHGNAVGLGQAQSRGQVQMYRKGPAASEPLEEEVVAQALACYLANHRLSCLPHRNLLLGAMLWARDPA